MEHQICTLQYIGMQVFSNSSELLTIPCYHKISRVSVDNNTLTHKQTMKTTDR